MGGLFGGMIGEVKAAHPARFTLAAPVRIIELPRTEDDCEHDPVVGAGILGFFVGAAIGGSGGAIYHLVRQRRSHALDPLR